MDMLDQYFAAIAAQLPPDARDDIVAELRDTLLSQIEAREEQLGRPVTDDEREAILRSMGHPLLVAARYRSGPRSLIGPQLFPYWLFAVKAGLAILVAVYALNFVVRLVSGSIDAALALSEALSGLIGSGLGLIGVITLAGAACEQFGIHPRYLDEWKVKDLGVLRLGDPANWASSVATMRSRLPAWPYRRTASSALGSLVAGIVFVLWWLGMFHVPAVVALGHGQVPGSIVAAPVWTTLHAPILIYALVQIALDGFAVVRPDATRLYATLQVPVALCGLALTWTIFRAADWFTLVGADGSRIAVRGGADLLSPAAWSRLVTDGQTLADLAADLSVILSWTMVAVAVGLFIKTAVALWRSLSSRHAAPRHRP